LTELKRPRLTVDLDAIRANHRTLREKAPGAEVAAVVKADGYGLGAVPVARALAEDGVATFFVAKLEEALALRQALTGPRIFVLEGLAFEDSSAFVEHDSLPVLNHPGELERWTAEARRWDRALPAALQIDSGMCRLGFAEAELLGLAPEAFVGIELVLVLSHLACAEDRAAAMNWRQLETFERLRRRVPRAPSSLANSAGIFLGADFHLDLCRPGIALYGVNPTPGEANPMQPVVTLEAPVLQVHALDAAGSVGYGATYPTRPGMRIATVGVGYADGLLRAAGAAATAMIGGVEVPLAGRISMDLASLDVSGLPEGAVVPGSVVALIGGPDGVDRFAAAAGTIGYEVLTRLGHRLERRYSGGAVDSERGA